MTDKLRVGVITKTHGLRGEVKLYPTTDDTEKFSYIKEFYLDNKGIYTKLKLSYAKEMKNMFICKFEDIDSIEAAEKIVKKDLYIDRKDAKELKEGENYISDLIDLKVISDTLGFIGYVKDVFPTGANHVMEISLNEDMRGGEKAKDTLLLPYIKQCILDVDLESKEVLVHILDGLLDI